MNAALHYSVTCAEDVPRIDAARSARGSQALRVAPLARAGARRLRRLAARQRAARDVTTPVASDVPVLILSGGLDPVTPPAYGDGGREALRQQPAHRRAAATATSCRRTPAGRGSSPRSSTTAGFATLPATCVDHFERVGAAAAVARPARAAP